MNIHLSQKRKLINKKQPPTPNLDMLAHSKHVHLFPEYWPIFSATSFFNIINCDMMNIDFIVKKNENPSSP